MYTIEKKDIRRSLVQTALMAALLASPVIMTGCETSSGRGALGGGAVGAGLGAVIGHNSHGRTAEGAAIGGAIGAATGAIAGHEVDKARRERESDRDYERRTHTHHTESGHYENRLVRTPSGEQYEERVWVPDPR